MTRPRKRHEGGRYYVHMNGSGIAIDASTNRSSLEIFRASADTIIECVAMPRVRVRDTGGSMAEWSVFVNGKCVQWFGYRGLANRFARDLRRALRGK